MKLNALLDQLILRSRQGPEVDASVEVNALYDDSRAVRPGGLFIARVGSMSDGHRFAAEAVDRGAVAIVAEHPAGGEGAGRIPWIEVDDSRRALVRLARAFYGDPDRDLRIVGITGTNGKTTTTFLGRAVLAAEGEPVGILGTVINDWGDGPRKPTHTTAGPLILQQYFSRMRENGLKRVVMEVSSHALDQERVDGCTFSTAVFTNLTQDHLEYHRTMDDYFSAKQRLFVDYPVGTAVVNLDDPYGQRLVRRIQEIGSGGIRLITFGLSKGAGLTPASLRVDRDGIVLKVDTPEGPMTVASPLMGRYNAYNLLAAIGIGLAEGIPTDQIVAGLKRLDTIPGRFERIEAGQPFQVVVDYAHTEDALGRLLEAARALGPKRLLTLFGCGGDRDRGKRPKMGRVAARWSDGLILTSDNPRGEDPREIIREIEGGINALSTETGIAYPYEVVVNRFDAIERILSMAQPGDLVVIAGKGHENEQTIGDRRIPFDDREVARDLLGKRAWAKQR